MERIKVENISYFYQNKYQTIEAVKKVSCTFESGKMYAVTGESGSGKSTFLSLLAGLDQPGEGRILVDGENLAEIDRDAYRRKQASVVYQAFHLFPLLTAWENVMYPMELQGIPRKAAKDKAVECLEEVGLSGKKLMQYPKMMSGGEQQRVAIARAMAAGGKILLADEPTGNLDSENEENIVELLLKLAHEKDYVVIIVTHNPYIAAGADVKMRMKDGKMISIEEQ
ncbi:ABC transporter ATP-binding protein [Faecalicatena orotica]|jgi:ABC-type lipoprotein export system ATPase subunit|uniref:Putative ABC transport system ATP-binding protein n=1 Tax=Faecalicatena orotica TaxID=1544 RepID=A0A2Y9BCR1_9FIRM|nr:ABC transporter ATP-binding protein [Faecalicatena orotica]PWJ32233.1 putative ABC transport system ATP-binding protein [Faecalicatena orotica]SSA54066.1 putative ABC transport system ATP-binding protein [Faecalicatena orotica]